MNVKVKKYDLQNCNSNINVSEIDSDSEIILTANEGYYFNNTPIMYLWDSGGYTRLSTVNFDKIDDFNYSIKLSAYENRIISIKASANNLIPLIYDLKFCENNNLNYVIPNTNCTIILSAKDGYYFKTNPYIKIEDKKSYVDVVEITLEKITNDIYSINLDATQITDNIYIIYVFGYAVERNDNFEESEINDNISYGLLSIYNPSKSELLELTKRTFLDNNTYADIEKNIYALRKVYFNIPNYERDNIRIGNHEITTVQSNIIKDEIINANCGNVTVEEYYKNAFDYDGFTTAKIFLPFIGFKSLEINNIMNSTVFLFYRLNVITGRIVAIIKTDKRGKIYTFQGVGGFDLLLTLNHYTNHINKVLEYDSEYMTGLTPFLQIFTKIPYNAEINPYGYYVNEWKKLENVNGYIECKELNFIPVNDFITLNEMEEIKSLCKNGIFL